jgi:hypothetical protein
MSHKLNCGCVVLDNRDRSVKRGTEPKGYIKSYCEKHSYAPVPDIDKLIGRLEDRYNALDAMQGAQMLREMQKEIESLKFQLQNRGAA